MQDPMSEEMIWLREVLQERCSRSLAGGAEKAIQPSFGQEDGRNVCFACAVRCCPASDCVTQHSMGREGFVCECGPDCSIAAPVGNIPIAKETILMYLNRAAVMQQTAMDELRRRHVEEQRGRSHSLLGAAIALVSSGVSNMSMDVFSDDEEEDTQDEYQLGPRFRDDHTAGQADQQDGHVLPNDDIDGQDFGEGWDSDVDEEDDLFDDVDDQDDEDRLEEVGSSPTHGHSASTGQQPSRSKLGGHRRIPLHHHKFPANPDLPTPSAPSFSAGPTNSSVDVRKRRASSGASHTGASTFRSHELLGGPYARVRRPLQQPRK